MRLLLALCILLAGCGALNDLQGTATLSGGRVTGSVSLPIPGGQVVLNPTGLRGELSVLLTLVDYTDASCPLSDENAQEVLARLDAFVARNTTGLAYVRGRVVRVTLGATADYTAEVYPEGGTDSRLQREARAATVGPERLRLYLLPSTPILATGGGFVDGSGGEAFLSCWTAWQNLPIPHEFGHALGLAHGAGVMSGSDAAAQCDWNGVLAARATPVSDCPPLPGPSASPVTPLTGPLSTAIILVSYSDASNPWSPEQAQAVGAALDRFTRRLSRERCWVLPRVVSVTLPGRAEEYSGSTDALLRACNEGTEHLAEPWLVSLLPHTPLSYRAPDLVFLGQGVRGGGRCWLSALEHAGTYADPLALPLPHEWGHALGLPHGGGVMQVGSNPAQWDWGGNFDAAAMAALGW